MKLLEIKRTEGPEIIEEGLYESDKGKRYSVYFCTQDRVSQARHSHHFFIVGLVAAFLRGETYTHPDPVDPILIENMQALMAVWGQWRGRKPVKIKGPTLSALEDERPEAKIAALLSGGVDSLFTAQTRASEVDVFVNILHSDGEVSQHKCGEDSSNLKPFAKARSKDLITVDTNMMYAFPEISDAWATLAHGACYAAVGHFLSHDLSRLLISSSFTIEQQRPWGSHPDTDYLLSSSGLEVEHVGIRTNRFEKHREIAKDKLNLKHLSVCEHGPQSGAHLNCSTCQKCLRSMIAIDLLQIPQHRAATFDWSDYRPDKLKAFLLPGHVNCSEMLEEADKIGREDISAALYDVIKYSQKYNWLVRLELFLRRRFRPAVRYKAQLKRLRGAAYSLMNIKTRKVEQKTNNYGD
ncbi:MAG: hypothetical protein AAGB16_07770 [Pseudomonadota bacterium]